MAFLRSKDPMHQGPQLAPPSEDQMLWGLVLRLIYSYIAFQYLWQNCTSAVLSENTAVFSIKGNFEFTTLKQYITYHPSFQLKVIGQSMVSEHYWMAVN